MLQRFNELLQQARLNLNPDHDEHVIFIYDCAPAHRNPANSGLNSELKMLPPHSLSKRCGTGHKFTKAAIEADISRPEEQVLINDRNEARKQGITLGDYRT